MTQHSELRMRVGREIGNTLHLQRGEEPSDLDDFVGSVATPEMAMKIAEAWNAHWPEPDSSDLGMGKVEQVREAALQLDQQRRDLDG